MSCPRESDIIHESGMFWVLRDKRGYLVLKTGATHSTTLCMFARNADGRSLAIAYCDYKAKANRPRDVKLEE